MISKTNNTNTNNISCSHISSQEFPKFSKFLQTHPWPVFNSKTYEAETNQSITIFLKQVPISPTQAESLKEQQINGSQLSLSLSLAAESILLSQNGNFINSFTQSFKDLTYKQLLEDIDSEKLAFLGQSKVQAQLEISIKPRDINIIDHLAADINQKVNVTEFILEFQITKTLSQDIKILSQILDRFPNIEHLNISLFFFLGTKYYDNSDVLPPLIQSLTKLKQLKRFDLKIGDLLNSLLIHPFLNALGQSMSLRKLSLIMKKCELDDHSAVCLAKSISQLTQLEEFELSIPNNKISTNGMHQILESISSSLCSLSKLSLNLMENKDSKENHGVIESSQLLSKVSRDSLRSLQIYFPFEDLNFRKTDALSEALLRFVNLNDLSIVFESYVADDCDTDDELEQKYEEEKQSYSIFFKKLSKLENLRQFHFNNRYLVSHQLAKRQVIKHLPQLVVLTGMR